MLALVSPYRHFGRYGDRQRPHIFILALTPLTWSMVTPFRRPLPIAKVRVTSSRQGFARNGEPVSGLIG